MILPYSAMFALRATPDATASLSIVIAKNPSDLRIFVSNESGEPVRCDYLTVGRTLSYDLTFRESGAEPKRISSKVMEVGQEPVRKDGKDAFPPSLIPPRASLFYDWAPNKTYVMEDGLYTVQFWFRQRQTKFRYADKIENLETLKYVARWQNGKFVSLALETAAPFPVRD